MEEGRDHGEMLTRFEEFFGSVVEHEVIKLILQSCDWNATMASETLLGMIDKNDLPPHVLSVIQADSLVRSVTRRQPALSDTRTVQENINESTMHNSTSQTSSVNTVPHLPSAFYNNSTGCNETTNGRPIVALDSSINGENSPSFSPPLSPTQRNKDTVHISNDSSWVLAPAFVPGGSNYNTSDGDRSSGWSQGLSSIPSSAVPPSEAISQDRTPKGKPGKKEEIIRKIINGTKIMVLMRGLPGSGKSTLAKEIKGPSGVILSTDDYFCDKHGKYVYNSAKIGDAHQWNKHRAIQRLKEGRSPIIIDNTNLQAWEMKPYIQLGLQYGYELDIMEVDTPLKLSCKELARRNTHGVPAKKIEEMKGRYERDLKVEDLIAALQGLGVAQKNHSGSVNAGNNDLDASDLTPMCSPVRKKEIVDAVEESDSSNLDEERNLPETIDDELLMREEDSSFDSDEDVIVEGYYDQIIPALHHGVSSEELQLSEFVKSLNRSGSDTKETPSCDLENIDRSSVLKSENQDKVNTIDESIEVPIDLTLAVQTSGLKAEGRNDKEMIERTLNTEERADNLRNESHITYTKELENVLMDDERRVQTLLDEACKSIDLTKSEKEWDSLTSEIGSEDFSDEKFNDLVSSFGCALKKQIKNRDSTEAKDCNTASEVMSGDLAMYDLCSTMEDKTGEPLSSLITKLARSDETSNITSLKSLEGANEEDGYSIISPINDSHSNNLLTNSMVVNARQGSNTGSPEKEKKQGNDKHSLVTIESSPDKSGKNDDKKKPDIDVTNVTSSVPDKLGATLPDKDGSLSWECVDITSGVSSVNWDSKVDDSSNDNTPKSCRTQRCRTPGDPSKWLQGDDGVSESVSDGVSSWVAVEGNTPDWDTEEQTNTSHSEASPSRSVRSSKYHINNGDSDEEELQSRTGAISKLRHKHRRHNSPSPSSNSGTKGDTVYSNNSKTITVGSKTVFTDAETQTLSIDFETLQADHNLYELKVLYGRSHYVPVSATSCNFSTKGPLTKGELRLEKGTMTDNVYDNLTVSSFQNLVAFFPNIPKDDLRDVFEKCKHDSDWAMNVLLDSGYEMSDPSNITTNDVPDVSIETDSVDETTDDSKSVTTSSSDPYEATSDSVSEEKTRRMKQSKQPQDLAKKREIENSFELPESADDHVLRLTGKNYSDLHTTKIKRSRARDQGVKRSNSPSITKSKETVEEEEIEGAQYITLVMDPLFATQLNMLFGPVGECEISGELTHEDRSVVLPLEICNMIYKYWTRTVNGKFLHEAEILDSLVRQDELLARKLQEEENAAYNMSEKEDDEANDGLLEDQPVCFQEIMNLEQALQQSLESQNTEDTSISTQLNLQRLYREYPHIDPVAVKEEYVRNNQKYHPTVERLNNRFGKETGTAKTVIAPEALSRYEEEMIERAQQSSLQEQEMSEADQETPVVPDDPQVYRDEAQAHYHQRQEAFRKAQEAHRQGMKRAAAYYARIGNLHSEKLREANQRASHKILEAKNARRKDANCLDLHLLHVPEAVSATQAFLYERQRVLIARGINQMEVSLITGRGAHSAGGQAVLKPSIKEHLQKNGYSFYEANSGMLKVILYSKTS